MQGLREKKQLEDVGDTDNVLQKVCCEVEERPGCTWRSRRDEGKGGGIYFSLKQEILGHIWELVRMTKRKDLQPQR